MPIFSGIQPTGAKHFGNYSGGFRQYIATQQMDARLRDELFNREIFYSVFEAKVLYFDWCDVYNNFRPHSSLGYLAPAMYAALLLGQSPSPALQPR